MGKHKELLPILKEQKLQKKKKYIAKRNEHSKSKLQQTAMVDPQNIAERLENLEKIKKPNKYQKQRKQEIKEIYEKIAKKQLEKQENKKNSNVDSVSSNISISRSHREKINVSSIIQETNYPNNGTLPDNLEKTDPVIVDGIPLPIGPNPAFSMDAADSSNTEDNENYIEVDENDFYLLQNSDNDEINSARENTDDYNIDK